MTSALSLAFVFYCLILVSIGFLALHYNKSAGDFHLGGRRVNYWVTAISAHAGDMSHWLFIGFPFSVYLLGVSKIWVPIGLILGMWANWQFIAPKIRKASEALGSETVPDFLSKSVGNSSLVKFISCFFCIFFFFFYIASGLKIGGVLLNQLFGLSVEKGVFLSAFVITTYATVGGFFAISFVASTSPRAS